MGLREALARNLRQPRGLLGRFVGILMNKGNDYMNRFTINLLVPEKNDRILEIGFGNGKFIHELAKTTENGFIAGVDFSETMVQQAKKRNKTFIKQGIVDIKQGEVTKIPYDDHAFHKVFTVNTIYFWPNPETDLNEIYRVLRPDGKLLITFRSKERIEKRGFTKTGFNAYEPEEVVQFLSNAGFRNIRIETKQDKRFDVHCLVATVENSTEYPPTQAPQTDSKTR